MIEFSDGATASEIAVARLSRKLRTRIPESFAQFVRTHDGARPEPNIIRSSTEVGDISIGRFIPVDQIEMEAKYIENMKVGSFPICWAEGGNYIILDDNGSVLFWDHEQPDRPSIISNDFQKFVDTIEPFDIKSVVIDQKQIKDVWIDPEFAKHIK